MVDPPVVWQIELSETLADTKVIAECWDAAGLYEVGYFPGYRWAEWNGRFRDTVRRFVKGDPGLISDLACRLSGSADIYEGGGELPINSINFVTCHDGFTLNDLVSYNGKRNYANGEDNRDGIDDNMSWNCGVEGPSDDPGLERFRDQQTKNFASILMLSQGVPMMSMGDEVRKTQQGNNNAYCQDNELSWLDWSMEEKNRHLFRFWSKLIQFRKSHPVLHRPRFFTGQANADGIQDIAWHGCHLNSPGWYDPDSRILAYTLGGVDGDADLHVMLNMDDCNLEFEIPVLQGKSWSRVIDTSLSSPDDIVDSGQEVPITDPTYYVNGRSIVVLASSKIASA
jgi:glycogen operon protein